MAIIVPDPDFLPIWLKRRGISGSYLELCKSVVSLFWQQNSHQLYFDHNIPQSTPAPLSLDANVCCDFRQDVKNAILEDIQKLGKEAGLKSFEQVTCAIFVLDQWISI